MLEFIRRNWWKAVTAIAVGAVGSGTWEIALKPILSAIGSAILTVETLGIASLRDDVYLARAVIAGSGSARQLRVGKPFSLCRRGKHGFRLLSSRRDRA
jgi:hypothetical protein